MILSKRNFLAGASAFCSLGATGGLATAPVAQDFALDLMEGSLRLRSEGPETSLLRYGKAEPLTVLRARQGQPAQLRLHNGLSQGTSLQICGLRGEGRLDDAASVAGVAVGAGSEGVLPIGAAEAGLAWLRPRFDASGQAGRAAAGVLIVEPAVSQAADHDLVILLQDWKIDAQNRLSTVEASQDKGAVVITAGYQPLPSEWTMQPGARVRLRLLNASHDRVMVVACEGAKPMIVAIDGQPSELFEPIRDTVPIGPGARFEYLLDLPRQAGQSVRLVVRGTERIGGDLEADRVLAMMRTDGKPVEGRPPIAALPPNPALPPKIPLEASQRAELTIASVGGQWTVNGVPGRDMPKQPILRIKANSAVTLGFTNASSDLVPLSLYGQAVRLLHPNDDGWEPYWRDSVLLPPGSRNHVAFVADKPGRWPIESGFASQAVAGLRCWFEVHE